METRKSSSFSHRSDEITKSTTSMKSTASSISTSSFGSGVFRKIMSTLRLMPSISATAKLGLEESHTQADLRSKSAFERFYDQMMLKPFLRRTVNTARSESTCRGFIENSNLAEFISLIDQQDEIAAMKLIPWFRNQDLKEEEIKLMCLTFLDKVLADRSCVPGVLDMISAIRSTWKCENRIVFIRQLMKTSERMYHHVFDEYRRMRRLHRALKNNNVKNNYREQLANMFAFIGGLYLNDTFPTGALICCLEDLLRIPDDTTIFIFCHVLRSTGPTIEEKFKSKTAVILEQLRKRQAFLYTQKYGIFKFEDAEVSPYCEWIDVTLLKMRKIYTEYEQELSFATLKLIENVVRQGENNWED